jgi:hypothetical protein
MVQLTIADKLLNSCEELYRKGILSKNQYTNCLTSISGSDTRKQIRITEENIFSSSRDEKEGKYDEFIMSLQKIIDEGFENYNKATTEEEKLKYEEVITQIIILMNNIINWIQNVSLKRHQNKEGSQYEKLLFYYNKIDNNRKELEKINKQIITLEQRDITENDKSQLKKSSWITQRNIMISLIVFIIITIVIIFLIYFI